MNRMEKRPKEGAYTATHIQQAGLTSRELPLHKPHLGFVQLQDGALFHIVELHVKTGSHSRHFFYRSLCIKPDYLLLVQ